MPHTTLYAAPMEGLTTYLWRQAHRTIFGGVDKYFTPFLSPNANLCFQRKELDEIQDEPDTVPQLLTNRGDHFVWAARELQARGYGEVNFNLGCPSGTVTAKRKGSGLLAYPEELERCLDEIFDSLPDMRVSIKTRIGKNDPEEWEALLALYGHYPIHELIVHPRIQKEFYKGTVHRDAFDRALAVYPGRLVYNGDLFTAADVAAFQGKYPQVDTIMVGRGLMADPALGRRLRAAREPPGRSWSSITTDCWRLSPAAQRYAAGAAPDAGAVELPQRAVRGGERPLKAIRKANDLAAYEAAAKEILRNCPMK